MRSAWIEIDMNKMRENIRALQRVLSSNTIFMGVVKADGYGHGAPEVAAILKDEGIKSYAVAILQEGIQLRENGFIEPILILGYTPEEDFDKLIHYQLTPTIYTLASAKKLHQAAVTLGKKISIHLKVDTGMSRLGFSSDMEAINDILAISRLPHLHIEGIFSHMSSADGDDETRSMAQFNLFMNLTEKLKSIGIHIPVRHIGNSSVAIRYQQMHLDMVRVGISIYGIYPSQHMAGRKDIPLQQVMTVKARLVQVKRVPPSTAVSYGSTFVTDRVSVIGTIPIGYADGISAAMSNKIHVLVKGKRCPAVGRICMDQMMVDLTDVPGASAGDEVVVMGSQGGMEILADDLSELTGTIAYEIITRMSRRLPRVYMDKDKR